MGKARAKVVKSRRNPACYMDKNVHHFKRIYQPLNAKLIFDLVHVGIQAGRYVVCRYVSLLTKNSQEQSLS